MPSREELLKQTIEALEKLKRDRRFDEMLERDATLNVALFNLREVSVEAYKANVKVVGNTKIAMMLIHGPGAK